LRNRQREAGSGGRGERVEGRERERGRDQKSNRLRNLSNS